MKISKKFLIILFILAIVFMNNYVYGTDIDVDDYDPSKKVSSDVYAIDDAAGFIIKVIQVIGIIAGTVGIAMLGIRYMIGGVDDKAEFKETAGPYIFGIGFLFGSTALLELLTQIF